MGKWYLVKPRVMLDCSFTPNRTQLSSSTCLPCSACLEGPPLCLGGAEPCHPTEAPLCSYGSFQHWADRMYKGVCAVWFHGNEWCTLWTPNQYLSLGMMCEWHQRSNKMEFSLSSFRILFHPAYMMSTDVGHLPGCFMDMKWVGTQEDQVGCKVWSTLCSGDPSTLDSTFLPTNSPGPSLQS